jgi:hypothetical protein
MRTGAGKLLLVGVVLLAPALATTARAQVAPCEASTKVKEALRNLPESTGDSQADRAARIAALKALLKRYPYDLFVHSRYQDEAMYPTVKERDAVIAEYSTLAEKHAKDPVYAYLAARAQIGVNTKLVLPQLEALTSRVPSARLALVRIYQASNFKDPKKAREQLETFMKSCPATLSPYQYLRSAEPSEFLTQSVERLRTLLQSRTDREAIGYYSTLWSLEFRVKPAPEHEALRKQVAEDLKRLRAIDPGKNATYYSVLQNGYKLANDAEGEKWAAQQARVRFPRTSFYSVKNEFLKANPYAKPTDPPEKRKAFLDAYVNASAEWVRQWPNEVSAWFDRVGALREAEQVSPADVEAAGEGLLRTIGKNPNDMSFMSPTGGSSFALVVADLYATKGVRLDRLPDLVRDGIPELELLRTIGLPSDLYPPIDTTSSLEASRWYGAVTIADIWLKVKDRDRAREALVRLQTLAEQSKPKADPKDPQQAARQRTYLSRQVTYWRAMGDLAQLEGHKTDAMTFYQNALLARLQPPAGAEKDELAEKVHTLWKELGGSNEAWQAWFTRRDLFGQAPTELTAGGRWTKIEKSLPDFELADLSGAKWRLADFKGKTTLVGIWATW